MCTITYVFLMETLISDYQVFERLNCRAQDKCTNRHDLQTPFAKDDLKKFSKLAGSHGHVDVQKIPMAFRSMTLTYFFKVIVTCT